MAFRRIKSLIRPGEKIGECLALMTGKPSYTETNRDDGVVASPLEDLLRHL